MIIRSPLNKTEYDDYYTLRWQILRAPWGQDKGSEKDKLEDDAIHRIAIIDQQVIAVGRLHFVDKTTAQIRYMAIFDSLQNQGVGKLMLQSLEKAAKEKNIQLIILHAREAVVGFYKKQGYQLLEKSHLLFNEIQHYKMQKVL